MGQFHEVAGQSVNTGFEVNSSFIRIARHAVLGRGIPGPLKPPVARLISHKEIDGAILPERMNREMVSYSDTAEDVTPLDFRGENSLSLYMLRPSQRCDEVVQSKEHGPSGIRPEPDRVTHIIDDARNGGTQSTVIIIPVSPHIERS